jgi:hypothetical protein
MFVMFSYLIQVLGVGDAHRVARQAGYEDCWSGDDRYLDLSALARGYRREWASLDIPPALLSAPACAGAETEPQCAGTPGKWLRGHLVSQNTYHISDPRPSWEARGEHGECPAWNGLEMWHMEDCA